MRLAETPFPHAPAVLANSKFLGAAQHDLVARYVASQYQVNGSDYHVVANSRAALRGARKPASDPYSGINSINDSVNF
jgi:hypothetical protein